jgi:chaperonin GroES
MEILEIYDDRVLIKKHEQDKVSKGGIFIPDSVTSLPKSKATVIKTGPGFTDERTGEFFTNTVKEGDTVILSTYICHSGNEFIIEGEKYYLIRERDLDCGIVEDDKEFLRKVKEYRQSNKLLNTWKIVKRPDTSVLAKTVTK